eukprot:5005793-Amphidinium_carterae.1
MAVSVIASATRTTTETSVNTKNGQFNLLPLHNNPHEHMNKCVFWWYMWTPFQAVLFEPRFSVPDLQSVAKVRTQHPQRNCNYCIQRGIFPKPG